MKNITLISGGQTGADRAGLDFALSHEISHGGWCPLTRLAEDGHLAQKYNLRETPTKDYIERTYWNVRDSDGTVIFTVKNDLNGGTLHTLKIANKIRKPVIHICKETMNDPEQKLLDFISENNISSLNIAGPRASKEPEVYEFVLRVLEKTFL